MFKNGDTPVPGYHLIRFVGRGAYGEVWETQAPGGARVALKFIPLQSEAGGVELKSANSVKLIRHANLIPMMAIWVLDHDGNVLDDQAIERFEAEVKSTKTITRDNLEFKRSLAYLVIAMALADESLEDKLEYHRHLGLEGIPVEELVEYIRQAAKGLDFLNEPRHVVNGEQVGIVHRDVKPANLLLLGDSVVVGDFGVATSLREFDEMATELVGSLGFMAPESIARRPTSTTDQYALAITYYYLLTGEMPYGSDHTFDSLAQLHKEGRLDFSLVEGAEHDVLRKATALPPSPRYDNCADFVDALTTANRKPDDSELSGGMRFGPSAPIIAGVAVFLAILGAVGWWLSDLYDTTDKTETPNRIVAATPELHKITFWPPDTEFELDIRSDGNGSKAPAISGKGDASIGLTDTDQLQVNAVPRSTLYIPIVDKLFTRQQLESLDWGIRLKKRSVSDLREQAFELLESDQWEQATLLLAGAMEDDRSVLDFPAPQRLVHDFEVISLSPGERRASYSVVALDGYHHGLFRFPVAGTKMELADSSDAWIDSKLLKVREAIQLPGSAQCLILFSDSIGTMDVNGEFVDAATNGNHGVQLFTACSVSQNGRRVAVGDSDGKIHLWSVSMDGLDEHQSLNAHKFAVAKLLFDRTGSSLLSFGLDCSLSRLQINANDDVQVMPIETPESFQEQMFVGATLTAENRVVVATQDQLYIADFGGSTALRPLDVSGVDDSIVIVESAADSPWILIGTESVTDPVLLFNTQTHETRTPKNATEFSSIASAQFSVDARWAAVSTYLGHLWLADLATEAPRWYLISKSEDGHRRFLNFTSDSKFLVGILESKQDKSGTEEVWNLDECKLIITAQRQSATVSTTSN